MAEESSEATRWPSTGAVIHFADCLEDYLAAFALDADEREERLEEIAPNLLVAMDGVGLLSAPDEARAPSRWPPSFGRHLGEIAGLLPSLLDGSLPFGMIQLGLIRSELKPLRNTAFFFAGVEAQEARKAGDPPLEMPPKHARLIRGPFVEFGRVRLYDAGGLTVFERFKKTTRPQREIIGRLIAAGAKGVPVAILLQIRSGLYDMIDGLVEDPDWDAVFVWRNGPHGGPVRLVEDPEDPDPGAKSQVS